MKVAVYLKFKEIPYHNIARVLIKNQEKNREFMHTNIYVEMEMGLLRTARGSLPIFPHHESMKML